VIGEKALRRLVDIQSIMPTCPSPIAAAPASEHSMPEMSCS
jgi:hypothetical protein